METDLKLGHVRVSCASTSEVSPHNSATPTRTAIAKGNVQRRQTDIRSYLPTQTNAQLWAQQWHAVSPIVAPVKQTN